MHGGTSWQKGAWGNQTELVANTITTVNLLRIHRPSASNLLLPLNRIEPWVCQVCIQPSLMIFQVIEMNIDHFQPASPFAQGRCVVSSSHDHRPSPVSAFPHGNLRCGDEMEAEYLQTSKFYSCSRKNIDYLISIYLHPESHDWGSIAMAVVVFPCTVLSPLTPTPSNQTAAKIRAR